MAGSGVHGLQILGTGTPRWALLLALLLTLLAPVEPAVARALTTSQPLTPRATDPAAFSAGVTAIVDADGDCLRMRAGPGTALPQLTCLPHGSAVTIVPGRVVFDGMAWQQVQSGGRLGWVVEQYLREGSSAPPTSSGAPAAPSGASAAAVPSGPLIGPGCTALPNASTAASQRTGPAIPPGINGVVPEAGSGLIVWGGGSAEEVAASAATKGCALRSVWAPADGGGIIGYSYGAPDFVNKDWLDRFVDGIDAGTPLILVCGGAPDRQIVTAHALGSIPPPTPTGLAPVAVRALPPPAVSASSVAVIDAASGAVIYESNAHRSLPPASLTKIATAILTVEAGRLDAWVPISIDSREMGDSSVMGLRPGDCFRAKDLLFGLMLPSGNDAALALGRFQAGGDEAFVGRLNALVVRIGLQETRFANAHGLNASGHYSSAYDLAMLARYAMTLPDFVAAAGTRQWTAQGSRTIGLTNTNTLLAGYAGADGVKTGFTEEAGRTLVASATRNGHRVFIALLNAPERDADARKLFDWTFTNFVFR